MNDRTNEKLNLHSLRVTSSVRDALKALNSLSGETMTLFIIDETGRLAGTLTDGDIRRALVEGVALEDPVEKAMHTDYLSVKKGDDFTSKIAQGRERHVMLLPVVDDGFVVDFIDLRHQHASLPIDAVLMAGGKGERLRPLTEKVPKPLLEVGGKPIIDYNVDELEACGVKNIFVTVNYLASQIEDHFSRRKGRVDIKCVREPSPLGTIGSLALVEGLVNDNVLVMNSDILTNMDFESLYLRHREDNYDITVATVPYTVSVPFAIMRLNGERVEGMEEKPTFNYFANAGVYMIKRRLLERIPREERLDAPDFIVSVIERGGKVGCFPIDGTWIDIGSPDDFRYANELMGRRRLHK